MERLDKRLSDTGRWSRKEARGMIRAGRVSVDESVCRRPEEKVGSDSRVLVDGEGLDPGGPVYLMLHKPAGLVSATEDIREKTVLSLDWRIGGVGSNSCGPEPQEKYRAYLREPVSFTLVLTPYNRQLGEMMNFARVLPEK